MQPLRRKPKELIEDPTLFVPAQGSGGMVLSSGDRSRTKGSKVPPPGGTVRGETEEAAEEISLADLEELSAADRLVRSRAAAIARRLALTRPPMDRRTRRGVGPLRSTRWTGSADELDLDATVEAIAGKPFPEDDDVIVRERARRDRSVVLVVDVSGSMRGERVRTAAATVGALAGELARDRVAVVAFWSDAAVLVRLGEPVAPLAVLDLLLRVPTQGLTNVAFALETALAQLSGVAPRDARVLLLSDAVHNAGPDPRGIAARLPRLDVLLDTSGENDLDLGRDLAYLGRGRCRTVRDHTEVPAAVTAVFTD